jgi:hypothetical protein
VKRALYAPFFISEERGKRKEERGKRKEERGKRKEERGKEATMNFLSQTINSYPK